MKESGLLTDCHIHFFPVRNLKNDVIIKKSISDFFTFKYICRYHGLNLKDPDFEKSYLDYLDLEIQDSKKVRKGIIFGLDGIYKNGEFDFNNTRFFISNDFIYKESRKRKNLLFGASINPRRKDAIDELHKVIDKKAALVKVLPNSQNFSLDDPANKPFFKEMAKNKIPLLCHTGYEFALKAQNQSYGNPLNFRMALDEGVIVIGAHGGSAGLYFYEPYKKTLIELIENYPNFYLDSSALTIASRLRIVPFLQRHPEITRRMTFGTDFPLPVYFFPFVFKLGIKKLRVIKKEENYFDRYLALMKELGFGFKEIPNMF